MQINHNVKLNHIRDYLFWSKTKLLSLTIDFHFELNRLLISISIKLIKRYTEFDNTQECIFNFFYFTHKEYKQLCLMMKNLSICS